MTRLPRLRLLGIRITLLRGIAAAPSFPCAVTRRPSVRVGRAAVTVSESPTTSVPFRTGGLYCRFWDHLRVHPCARIGGAARYAEGASDGEMSASRRRLLRVDWEVVLHVVALGRVKDGDGGVRARAAHPHGLVRGLQVVVGGLVWVSVHFHFGAFPFEKTRVYLYKCARTECLDLNRCSGAAYEC